ncbi:MAG: hypothetical protein U0169_22720 [Polyangiaceae bacterium]
MRTEWIATVVVWTSVVLGCSSAPATDEASSEAGDGGASHASTTERTADAARARDGGASASPVVDAGSSNATESRPTGPVPKLLVRGFGKDLDPFIGGLRTFDDFKKLLQAEGFDPKDAHDLGNYDDSKSMDEMTNEVGAQLEAAMAKYPSGTKFDVMGHSLGGIVALRGIFAKNLSSRVRTFVSLSAPIYGQDQKPANCALGLSCGDIYDFYTPYNGPKLTAYMAANASSLAAMKLCSLIGPDDGTITAPMAGAQFPGGTNVVVNGVNHVAVIRSAPATKALKDQCFGGAF